MTSCYAPDYIGSLGVIGNSIVPGTELGKLFDKIHRAHRNGRSRN